MPKAYNSLPLRPAQQAVFNDQRRFRAAIAGRRWGKTYLACAELGRGAESKVGHYLYLAPSDRMAKDIGWEAARAAIPGELIEEGTHSTLSLWLKNGSTIQVGSVQTPSYWKGFAFRGVVLDEFAKYDFDVWRHVVAPRIADLRGWALFLTTPRPGSLGPCWGSIRRGICDFSAQGHEPIYCYSSLEGGNTSGQRVEEARKLLSEQAFRAEYEGKVT